MSRDLQTSYEPLSSQDDEECELPLQDANVYIHEAPQSGTARWNHIEDLDDFFTRIYHYHQQHGFLCMALDEFLQLVCVFGRCDGIQDPISIHVFIVLLSTILFTCIDYPVLFGDKTLNVVNKDGINYHQYVFIVLLSTILFTCIDYPVLFGDKTLNGTRKVTIPDVIKSHEEIEKGFTFLLIVCLIIAGAFLLFRILKVLYNLFKYDEICAFYKTALRISAHDLPNMTWHEVQRTMLDVQKDVHMCIHKQELTELDIYHRILRFKNYMIAMVNKSVIDLRFNVPFLGYRAYLSTSLKYNLEMILFWGPWSVFENNWHLRDVYKQSAKRKDLATSLSRLIFWIGVANLVFSPVIFLWQILYCFFRYGELIKREPGLLGSRRWSEYGRLYLRHFNELDHEFRARLNRAYKPATAYLNIFTNPIIVIFARNIAFVSGSVLAILIVLTVIDEDVLTVEHILTTMTLAGLIVTACRVFIPDHNAVQCPEQLLLNILAHIHYMPDNWRGHAHTEQVRDQFSLLFNYKAIYLLEELLSPFITPFILIFYVRHRALHIVDFFRNFTVDVVGVGDVCSFAQMDIRKHGHPHWKPTCEEMTGTYSPQDVYMQTEEGKTELSLMHFHMTNPEWVPPQPGEVYINNLKQQAQHDATSMVSMATRMDNPVFQSLASLQNPTFGLTSVLSSTTTSLIGPPVSQFAPFSQTRPKQNLRGAVSSAEGPLSIQPNGLLSSIHSDQVNTTSLDDQSLLQSNLQSLIFQNTTPSLQSPSGMSLLNSRRVDDATLEFLSTDMSFSALYMHETRHRRLHGTESVEDAHARSLWQRTDSIANQMPGIDEESEESRPSDNVTIL